MDLNSSAEFAVRALLAASGLLVVAEAVGFLPDKLSRWLNRNRTAQTIATLREMGVDTDLLKRRNAVASLTDHFRTSDLSERVADALRPMRLETEVRVGSVDQVLSTYFIDLMGGTTDRRTAMMFARYLEAFWRDCIESQGAEAPVDFVVTPKSGSPILGYEFANALTVPFMLHNHQRKFVSASDEFRACFDCNLPVIPKGSRGLVIDDSSTGGDKVLKAIIDLRKFGYVVKDCLIVFEPQLKAARRKISERGVRLHSIIKV